jgi:alanine-synthesizing transaminase
LSGEKEHAQDFINGLMTLASMRLCANVPAQHIIQEALEHEHSIKCLIDKDGKLCRQRNITYSMLNDMPGISCVKPQGSLYAFPRLDLNHFNIKSDQDMALELLEHKHVLIVHGTGFNWHQHDHFRIVFLPEEDMLIEALTRIGNFFEKKYIE